MKIRFLMMLMIMFLQGGLQGKEIKSPVYWPLQIGKLFFPRIELALTEKEQQTGLMGRKHLEEDEGMLFVRNHAEILSFWMKNTLIPLDIIYLDSNGVIVKIWRMPVEPAQNPEESLSDYQRRLPTYSSEKPAAFALELKGGITDLLLLKPGDQINLEPDKLRKLLDNLQ